MKWKINQLSSRLVKVVPHTMPESIVIHLLVAGVVGWLTFESYKGDNGWITYLGLGVTLIFSIVILFDIYIMISNYRSRKKSEGTSENS